MDVMISYLLASLVILFVSLFLIFQAQNTNNNGSSPKLPPGSIGWPIVGESMRFSMQGPEKFITDKMNECSPNVFRATLMGEKMAVFCGPMGNKFLFSNENRIITSWLPPPAREALPFPAMAVDSMREVASLKRNFLHEILKQEALHEYIPIMDSMAREHIEAEWIPFGEVKVLPSLKKFTFELACKLFMNIEDAEYVKRLSNLFTLITPTYFSLPINLPGTARNRTIKGRELIRDELLKIIRQRIKDLSSRNHDNYSALDLLSRMVLFENDENDESLKEMKIANVVVGLLFASHDTTSGAVSTVLDYLAQLPHVYNEVLREQMEIAKSKGGEGRELLLNREDIEKMEYSWNVAREALRLSPPALGAFREATADFTYDGYTIPKGWKALWTVHSTHKNPDYFPNPENFDPSRFQGSGPPSFTFVPFGGGPRMCPGRQYARLQILVFIYNIVTRFKLKKKVKKNNKKMFSPSPKSDFLLLLQPHET